jgi:Glycosyltransferase WbsX
MTDFGIFGRLKRRFAGRPAPDEAPAVAAPRPEATAEVYAALRATASGERSHEYVDLTTHGPVEAPPVTLIAFYLPQFHPIPENDRWWGRGFTEWTNVSRAVPQFVGHYQPHLPGELGFYDVRVPDVLRRQVELARLYGLSAFCFHYYWFAGKRLLERPLEQFMADSQIDFPFCLCWANENWTRRWDGREDDVLMAQDHNRETDAAFIADAAGVFGHRNYLRFDGRPVLVVYHPRLLPEPAVTAKRWREHCVKAGLGNPYLVAAQVFERVDPTAIGFDAAVEFPPNTAGRSMPEAITSSLAVANQDYTGAVYRYADLMRPVADTPAPPYPLFRTVCPSWDNEARKPGRGSTYAFSTPALYGRWLDDACQATLSEPDPGKRLVFINAWNEWAEGAHLEPDRRFGYAYLQATRDVVEALAVHSPVSGPQVIRPSAVVSAAAVAEPTAPWRRDVAAAVAAFEASAGRAAAVLDWNSGVDLASALPASTVFAPPDPAAPTLPHVDASIDVVACADRVVAMAEARRVARALVLVLGDSGVRVERVEPGREVAPR